MSLSKKCLWLAVVVAAIGCTPKTPVASSSSAPSAPTSPTEPAAPTTPALSGGAGGLNLPGSPEAVVGGASAQPTQPATPVLPPAPGTEGPPADPQTEQVKAEAGVGLKGQSLQGETGVLVEPAKAYFRVEQRAVFEIQIPSALKLFQATEGRFPDSEAEFMSKIIAANNINLPKLPPGQKYVYNVEKAELMVERPKK